MSFAGEGNELRDRVLGRLESLTRTTGLPHSQVWLARQIGRRPEILNRWLSESSTARRPCPLDARRALAIACGMPRDWLLPAEAQDEAAAA